jgi:hypothetical protein
MSDAVRHALSSLRRLSLVNNDGPTAGFGCRPVCTRRWLQRVKAAGGGLIEFVSSSTRATTFGLRAPDSCANDTTPRRTAGRPSRAVSRRRAPENLTATGRSDCARIRRAHCPRANQLELIAEPIQLLNDLNELDLVIARHHNERTSPEIIVMRVVLARPHHLGQRVDRLACASDGVSPLPSPPTMT